MDRTDMLKKIEQHYATFWQGDLDELAAQLAPDFIDDESPDNPPGWEAVRDHAAAARTLFPDMTVSVDEAVVEGPLAAVVSTWRGTFSDPTGGSVPGGRQVEFKGIVMWRFDSQGRIVRRTSYNMREAAAAQLGPIGPLGDAHVAATNAGVE